MTPLSQLSSLLNNRTVRLVATGIVTAASVVVTQLHLGASVKEVLVGVLSLAGALGIVPLHLDFVDEAKAAK